MISTECSGSSQDLQCQLEVSKTKLSALQQLHRSEEEDTRQLVEVQPCIAWMVDTTGLLLAVVCGGP